MAIRRTMAPGALGPAHGVSTIELLFDLVFVFVVSQATSAVEADHSPAALVRTFVVLALVWWMYDAYAWVTNAVAPTTLVLRLALVAAMGAFLVLALTLPDAFGTSGLAFGIAYVVVVALHLAMLSLRGLSPGDLRAAAPVLCFNLACGALLIVAAFTSGWLHWLLFLAPMVLFALSGLSAAQGPTSVGASHFVERHGLFMLIAFGESIVAVGSGAARGGFGLDALLGVVLTVSLVAALWWCYFSRDDEATERSLDAMDARRRTLTGLTAFGLCHLVMLFGLVCLAAGLNGLLVHPRATMSPASAWLLGAGVATYLVGEAEFRRELVLGSSPWRVLSAILVLLATLLDRGVAGIVHGGLVLLLVVGALVAEALAPARRPPHRD